MMPFTALRKMSLVLSKKKLRLPIIRFCHEMRFLSLAVSSVCAASLRLSSDWCLAFSFISSRWWSLCMVWILPCNNPMVPSCVEISWRKLSISPFRTFDLPVAQPTAASRSSLPFSLFSLERFSLIALSRSSLCRSFRLLSR